MFNFSVIIPHYNIPDLLVRCLNSIPVRGDIQVIVVDDCTPGWTDILATTPELHRPFLELLSTNKGGSAGRARNLGIKHATGKWLCFMDADDFFSDQVIPIFESVVERTDDIIFFRSKAVMSDDINSISHRNFYAHYFDEYLESKDDYAFRYNIFPLWGKLFSRTFICKNKICFEETRYSNDVRFSILSGIYASKVSVDNRILYFVTQRQGSLASSQFNGNIISFYELRTRWSVVMRLKKIAERNHIDSILRDYKKYFGLMKTYYRPQYIFEIIKLLFTHPDYAIEEVFGVVRRRISKND